MITAFFQMDKQFFYSDMVVGCKELFPLNLLHISTGLIFSFLISMFGLTCSPFTI
jgi:hypothetical protein